MTDLFSIDSKRDIIRSPLKLVSVPVVAWVKLVRVVMVLKLVVAISIDYVCGEWV